MPNELPSGDLAVYVFLEFFALGFALEAVWAFVHDPVWWKWIAWTMCALLFFFAGIKWPWIRTQLGVRAASKLERIASDRRYRNGAVLVIVGYFAVTGLLYVHTLRGDLDMYVMPRIITDKQSEDLRGYLSTHEAHPVTVKVNPLDSEAREYAAQLLNALKRAGWDAEFNTSEGPPSTMNDGVCIDVMGESVGPPDPKHDPKPLLQDAFRAANIDANCGGSVAAGEYKLFILVGHRPLVVGDREPMLSKLGHWLERLSQ